jgi:hypothetical protein
MPVLTRVLFLFDSGCGSSTPSSALPVFPDLSETGTESWLPLRLTDCCMGPSVGGVKSRTRDAKQIVPLVSSSAEHRTV